MHLCDVIVPVRMSTFVTLAEVLESRAAPLEEDEVWALLLGATEALIDISSKGRELFSPVSPSYPFPANIFCLHVCSSLCPDDGNMCCVISPGSMLLSAVGSIAFKTCSRSEDVGSFTCPEMSQSNTSSRRLASEKVSWTTVMWR